MQQSSDRTIDLVFDWLPLTQPEPQPIISQSLCSFEICICIFGVIESLLESRCVTESLLDRHAIIIETAYR